MGGDVSSGLIRRLIALCLLFGLHQPGYAQQPGPTDSLIRALSHSRKDSAKAALLIRLSLAFRGRDLPKQFYYANEALALAGTRQLSDPGMDAEWLIGDAYIQVQAYQDAITHLKKGAALAGKAKRTDKEILCLQLMVHCYHMLGLLEDAAARQLQLLRLTMQTGDPLSICNQMSAYAQRLADLKRYPEAIAYLREDIARARARFTGRQQARLVADLENTLATTYAKVPAIPSGLACLDTAGALARELQDTGLTAYIHSSYCDLYAAGHAYGVAIRYGQQTVREAMALKDQALQQQYTSLLSRLYQEDRQPQQALQYHLQADSLAELINHPRQTMDQAMQLIRINMEQQAAHIRLEQRAFEATRKNQQAWLVATLVALLAALASALLFYRNLRQKQRSNRIISRQAASLQEQNGLIDRALKEKEVMLKETHHRIKNNLQLISSLLELQVAELGDDAPACDALRSAQRRIQSIATAHHALSGNSNEEAIEFSGFAGELFSRLLEAFSVQGRAVRLMQEIPSTPLPLNTAVLLGLALNELFTNSFKHAFHHTARPVVRLMLQIDESGGTLIYEDNGPGLPPGLFDTPSGSLGLYLVKRISRQLKGTANYTYHAGSRFTIQFRIPGH